MLFLAQTIYVQCSNSKIDYAAEAAVQSLWVLGKLCGAVDFLVEEAAMHVGRASQTARVSLTVTYNQTNLFTQALQIAEKIP